MCGIAGIVNFSREKIQPSEIKKVIRSVKHRGPDDDGYWQNFDKNILLINTRLSVQDLSKNGSQPMISEDNRYVIIFNGEIYNFKELKKNYLKNEFFLSNSDTEVILKLFIKHGHSFLKFLEGMFAIAIYDNKLKKLFLARDEFGVKPLYYFCSKKKIIFSSEIKTFFKLNLKKKINLRSISSYLTSEYYENNFYTFYQDIQKIEPGHYLEICDGKIKKKKYFYFHEFRKKIFIPKNYSERKEKLKYLIRRSVELGMVSDVPISIASSGGLDSSILQYEANKQNKNISLISWDFHEQHYSEKKFVKEISKITNLESIFYKIKPQEIIKSIKNIISLNEEPFAGIPIISYYLTLKNINNNKVILDGSGIDEAHAGYDKYFLTNSNYSKISQDGTLGVRNIINDNFLKKNNNFDNEINYKNNFKNKMYNDIFFTKLPRALRFRDKISMSLGTELRPVFLNKQLISFLFNLKKNDHKNNGFSKYILRDAYK
ncbi:asparagine synthase (glutamine-hydrolyzing), partial [Candidatus Pelagibacter sp.]|nr:asparagine synthase (glutamine-hydrolyzing) [Candidatus Pelagibacter sp.]